MRTSIIFLRIPRWGDTRVCLFVSSSSSCVWPYNEELRSYLTGRT